ncbi:hydrogenase maturation protease [Rhodoferax sp. GW822-FHT02A01]|uniref:hydrogenase maturation protease n=1 Tax=Rhodoferax sp. GW822-FHT02A01 TaxID=3141537 RepID=UPI00315D912C
MNPAPPELLVLGWGNLSRGDDALGPRCLTALREALPPHLMHRVEFLEDYQLQVEFALDLVGRKHVLFIDASVDCVAPFEVRQAQPRKDSSISSHALSPEALLQVFVTVQSQAPPLATVLAIRASSFELGEPMTAVAEQHLEAAAQWAMDWTQALLK